MSYQEDPSQPLTTEDITEQYDTVNDALDDYLDAKTSGQTTDCFDVWFKAQFSTGSQTDTSKHILDGPDVPPVDFPEDDEDTGSAKPKVPVPSGGGSGYMQEFPTPPEENPPELVAA